MAGVLTLEDLVEELVGDIFSEHSRHVPQRLEKEPGGSIVVSRSRPVLPLPVMPSTTPWITRWCGIRS